MPKWKRNLDARAPVLAGLALLAADGCASQMKLLQEVSADKIGCPADAVLITDVRRDGTRPRTWGAACQDRFWACANDWGHVRCVDVEPPPR